MAQLVTHHTRLLLFTSHLHKAPRLLLLVLATTTTSSSVLHHLHLAAPRPSLRLCVSDSRQVVPKPYTRRTTMLRIRSRRSSHGFIVLWKIVPLLRKLLQLLLLLLAALLRLSVGFSLLLRLLKMTYPYRTFTWKQKPAILNHTLTPHPSQ